MAPTAVVFDWYATLATPNVDDFWTRLPEIVTTAGGEPDAQALADWEGAHPVEHRDHSADEASYRAWQRSRLAQLFERCGIVEPRRSRLLDEIDAVRYSRLFGVFPDVMPAITELRAQGVTVGLCSNWDWDLDRHLRHNGLDGLLDFVVCSAPLGYRKPHRVIFDEVVRRARVAPNEVVFVGDGWHDDVAGARHAGLKPVHIVRSGPCAVDRHDGVACITTLDDIGGIGL
ncbi:MAG TPA: HAD family hydrolase [Acidimicrobiales bacterium]